MFLLFPTLGVKISSKPLTPSKATPVQRPATPMQKKDSDSSDDSSSDEDIKTKAVAAKGNFT